MKFANNDSDIQCIFQLETIPTTSVEYYTKIADCGDYKTLNTFESVKSYFESYNKFVDKIKNIDAVIFELTNSLDLSINKNIQKTLYSQKLPDNLCLILRPLANIYPWNQQRIDLFVKICKTLVKILEKKMTNKNWMNKFLIDVLFDKKWIYTGRESIPKKHEVKSLLHGWYIMSNGNINLFAIKELMLNIC